MRMFAAIMVAWFALGCAFLVGIAWAKWVLVEHHSTRMRSAARRIDDGDTCPCCHAQWFEVDEAVSISGNEFRTRTTLHMDHDDWCDYAEWAGL